MEDNASLESGQTGLEKSWEAPGGACSCGAVVRTVRGVGVTSAGSSPFCLTADCLWPVAVSARTSRTFSTEGATVGSIPWQQTPQTSSPNVRCVGKRL